MPVLDSPLAAVKNPVTTAGLTLSFGPFRLVPAQQLLLQGDEPVRLGSRALEILIVLVEHAGETVGKEELIHRVWPDTFVEEGNLRVHVAALRRALGGGQAGTRYIANIPGRGYRFLAPVSVEHEESLPRQTPLAESTHNLPAAAGRMLGRDEIVDGLVAQLPVRRFVTIVGPGGIGKTTVALAVADRCLGAYPDGVCFVDLASLTDPLLVPSTLASTLGIAIHSGSPLPSLIAALRDRKMLLVLDSCEHLIEAAALLAEEVFKGAPTVHILATSRESLRAEGERVQRLLPLSTPGSSGALTAAEALSFPAVQLFVERAASCVDGFELADEDAPVVAEICRRLDGIALAIELAAGRLDAFGVHGLAAQLDDRFRILTAGRRTALPRHQTLTAILDWSYERLPPSEARILRRLAVLAGGFSLETARGIVADPAIAGPEVVEGLANLVAKSLVTADFRAESFCYRLLDTTRAYSHQKLAASGELDHAARRHAEYFRDLFQRAEAEWQSRAAKDWLAVYGRHIADLRAALTWAFSPGGDPGIGVALTVTAVPLWFQLSMIDECRRRVECALSAIDPASPGSSRNRMQLHAALGWSLMYTTGTARETGAEWANALAIAEALDDNDYRLRALWGLWAGRMNNGEFDAAHRLAERFCGHAEDSRDPGDRHIGDRMMGASLHFLGDQGGARRHIEAMLEKFVTPSGGSHIVRYQFDQRITAHITLARVLWLQGFPEQAMHTVETSIGDALSIEHTLSLCNALVQSACPIALLVGDVEAAGRFVDLLRRHTATHGLEIWRVYLGGFQAELHIRRGDVAAGMPLLRAAVDGLRSARFVQYHAVFLGSLAVASIGAGQVAEARAAIDEALARTEATDDRWYYAELLRIRGEVTLEEGAEGAATSAETYFMRSLDCARRQAALAWELRTATSLARLWRDTDRRMEAGDLLGSIHGRFTEGFATADLQSARELLAELQ